MSENILLFHLLLGFVIGGAWIASITFFAELRGSNFGGFVAGLPSTVAFGFLFIGWNQSAEIAVEATTRFPLFYSFAGVFLLCYAVFTRRRGFWRALTYSLLIWFGLTTLVAFFSFQGDFLVSLLVFFVISSLVYSIFVTKLSITRKLTDKSGSRLQVILRFFMGGGIVSLAILTSQLAGPQVGVIPTAFPAISCTSLFVLNRIQGLEFSRAFAMPIFVSSSLTVIPYVVAMRLLYPLVGIWWGTLGAYLIAVPFALVAYFVLHPELVPLSRFLSRRID